MIATDARRLRQVLDGLAENALRLLPPGAPLVLALRADPRGVVLEVRDGGPGLAPEDYPVAFEQGVLHERYRGRRPDRGGPRAGPGAQPVVRMGGTIAAPAPEGGVCMTIELPFDVSRRTGAGRVYGADELRCPSVELRDDQVQAVRAGSARPRRRRDSRRSWPKWPNGRTRTRVLGRDQGRDADRHNSDDDQRDGEGHHRDEPE